jgi:hypothetical protein
MKRYMLYENEIWEVTKEKIGEFSTCGGFFNNTPSTWKEKCFDLKRPLRDGFFITVGWSVRESLCKEVYKEEA